MSATFRLSPISEGRPFYLAIIAGLACAFVIGKALPSTMDAISAVIEPLCMQQRSGAVRHRTSSSRSPRMRCRTCRASASRSCACSRPRRVHAGAPACRFGHRLCHQGRNPLAIGGRSGRDVRGRSVVLRAAGRGASGLGQCQHDRARGIDRGVRGRRGRAAHDAREVSCANADRRVGKAKRAHHLSRPRSVNGGHAALCPPYD